MNKKNLGSSETTREASSPHAFHAYIPYIPQHRRKHFDPTFLEWLVGFFEGDGNFQDWYQSERQTLRFRVCITQKDRALLANIRTELGYGTIQPITANDGMVYYQLRLETRQNVLAMLHLFAGNLRLRKVQKRFHDWAQKVCTQFNVPMPSNPQGLAIRPVSLSEGWFSGFFQAEGGFSVAYRQDTRYRLGYYVVLLSYIDQQDEKAVLDEIASLFHGWVETRNRETSSSRVWFYADLHLFVTYFQTYPVRGKKRISQSRWFRVFQRLQNKNTIPLPEIGTKAHTRFLRLIQNINQKNKKTR